MTWMPLFEATFIGLSFAMTILAWVASSRAHDRRVRARRMIKSILVVNLLALLAPVSMPPPEMRHYIFNVFYITELMVDHMALPLIVIYFTRRH